MFGRIRKIAKNYINSSYVDINDIEAVEDVVMIKDDNHKYQAELDKRKTRFELFYNLKNKGLNNTVIARRTGYSRDTVRKYLTHGIPNIKNKVVLNYDDYLDDINVMCRKKINPSAMHKIIKDKGFNGSIKSFTGWFNLKYPNYKFKWNRDFTVFNDEVIIKQSLPSCKQFTLYLLNNQYGVNKDTGEISKEKIFIDNLICKIPELSEMQETYRSFCSIINGNSVEQLEQLRDASVNSKISHIFSFFKGLKKDWEAICNAVRYKWTNSLVEGCVNRLKIKKREMYGRAGFDLLRRKVCLSVTG